MINPTDLALLDTNVLVYADQRQDKRYHACNTLRERARRGLIPVCVSPQVLNEFYAVMTKPRPEARRSLVGFLRRMLNIESGWVSKPVSPKDAATEVEKYYQSRNIKKIYPGPGIGSRMLELLKTNPVRGRDIHDVHLAATMLENGVTRIYTYNTRHFAAIPGIQPLNPEQVL